jgi:hypothetical protein
LVAAADDRAIGQSALPLSQTLDDKPDRQTHSQTHIRSICHQPVSFDYNYWPNVASSPNRAFDRCNTEKVLSQQQFFPANCFLEKKEEDKNRTSIVLTQFINDTFFAQLIANFFAAGKSP